MNTTPIEKDIEGFEKTLEKEFPQAYVSLRQKLGQAKKIAGLGQDRSLVTSSRWVSPARAEQEFYGRVDAYLTHLCEIYSAATPPERTAVRMATRTQRNFTGMLIGYAYNKAKELQTSPTTQVLQNGLIAISIEDFCVDYRDDLLALAELYVSAEEVGIDPQPSFAQVARISNPDKPRGGDIPVAQVLAEFDTYAVVTERRRQKRDGI